MRKKGKRRGNPDKIRGFQWKPGQSGNAKGRPRKERLADTLEEVLDETLPKEQDPRQSTFRYALIKNWVVKTIQKGDIDGIVEIFNRVDGKVPNRIALGGEEEGEPIRIERVDVKQFTDEELAEYEKLIRKATGPRSDD